MPAKHRPRRSTEIGAGMLQCLLAATLAGLGSALTLIALVRLLI